ncbi:MAG: NADH dehydrogenase (quinone) subunit D [Deltaproteobacteria bacterium]|nr:MAG: NADH dehydrogenase (quinone) subunit D [Deltaproteobacteria bacterium]
MSSKLAPIPTEKLVVNIGPSHPVTHGTLRIQCELDGETIVRSACEIGYLHRGFEKQSEGVFYEHVIPYTERLNYMGPVQNSNAWCYAVEQMLGIEAPPRAQAIRVITSEMGRITDHCVCAAANFVDLGGLTNFWYLVRYRERMLDLYEELCGARMMVNYPRIGGVSLDTPDGWLEKLRKEMEQLEPMLADVRGLVARNRIVLDRTQGVCPISQEDALNFGMTGPCLRATGIPYDLRKVQPYWGYDQYDFEVITRENGDTYDRIMLRFDEMEQSRRIILQAIDSIPDGPVMVDDPKVALPHKDLVYNTMEGLINHFKLVMHGTDVPAGEYYSATEGSNGELGFYIISDGGPKPYRVRIRPPCFMNYSAFPSMINGSMVADLVAALGSINVIAGELDR